jgi:hypothetical protein
MSFLVEALAGVFEARSCDKHFSAGLGAKLVPRAATSAQTDTPRGGIPRPSGSLPEQLSDRVVRFITGEPTPRVERHAGPDPGPIAISQRGAE